MERSGAGNGERRNVQGTFNVQLPYLSFTRSGAERGTGKEEMSREHTTMFSCLTFHLHGAERINKLGVDVYLYTSLRSAALPIINMERSGAGNGERRNVQGTYNNVRLPYLSFTRSGAD
jgi:hypothetical protein